MSNAYTVPFGPPAPGVAELGTAFLPKQLVRAMHSIPNADKSRCHNMSELLLGCPVHIYADSTPGQQVVIRGTITGEVRPEVNTITKKKDYARLLVDVRVDCILNQLNDQNEINYYQNKGVECITDRHTNKNFRKTYSSKGIATMSCYLTNPDIKKMYLLQLPSRFTPASVVGATKKTGYKSEGIDITGFGKTLKDCSVIAADSEYSIQPIQSTQFRHNSGYI